MPIHDRWTPRRLTLPKRMRAGVLANWLTGISKRLIKDIVPYSHVRYKWFHHPSYKIIKTKKQKAAKLLIVGTHAGNAPGTPSPQPRFPFQKGQENLPCLKVDVIHQVHNLVTSQWTSSNTQQHPIWKDMWKTTFVWFRSASFLPTLAATCIDYQTLEKLSTLPTVSGEQFAA